MSTIRHFYKLPQRVTKEIHKSKAAAYTYDLYEHEAKQLPEHYVERCKDFHRRDPKPIHFIAKEGKWEYQTNSKNIIPIQNVHIPLIFPEEANEGLWGGEGVIEGYRKSHKRFTFKIPKMWKPLLMTRALYSEILDQWFSVTVTFHTLDQIDEAKGFDFYILKTHERDINSRLGMVFRRKMLLALSNKDFYHDDPKKRSRVFRKYVKYLIPDEEIEWIGLSVPEALQKAKEIKESEKVIEPHKKQLMEDLVLRLTGHTEGDTENVIEEVSPLQKHKDQSKFLSAAKKIFKSSNNQK